MVLGLAGAWRGAVPPEQAVQWRTLRPGSGRLAVALSADGPTRCVRIRDRADPVSTVRLAERPIDNNRGCRFRSGSKDQCRVPKSQYVLMLNYKGILRQNAF